MKLLIGGLIVLGLLIILLLCSCTIYFIVLMINLIKETIEEIKE